LKDIFGGIIAKSEFPEKIAFNGGILRNWTYECLVLAPEVTHCPQAAVVKKLIQKIE
jgi:hypothetical protein